MGVPVDEGYQVMLVAGVQDLQIFGRVFTFAVAQVSGQYRQGLLEGSALLGDALEGIDRKAVPETVGHGGADISGADGFSGTAEANIAQGLVEPGTDEIIVEGFLGTGRQQVRIGIGSP
jgi:hypothetical protein